MDKSYVTLLVCPICKEDTGSLALDRRLQPKFEMRTATHEPCDKCRKKYLSKGVMLMNPDNGNLLVLKDKAFKNIINKPIPKHKIAFCDQELLDKINLMYSKVK